MRYISIRVRVTVWFTLMMALIVAAAVTFIAVVGGNAASTEARDMLVSVVRSNAGDVDYDRGVIDVDELEFFTRGVYTLMYSEDGELIAGAGKIAFEGDGSFENGVVRQVTLQGGEYLVYDLYVENRDGNVWLRGFCSADGGSGAVRTVTTLALIIFPALLVIAALGGWLIAGAALRPAGKIAAAAEAISDGSDLSGRIGLKKGRDEVHRLAAAFDRMFERLEHSFIAEKQFASDASHELRTPTTVILAQCDYALRGEKTPEEYRESLEVVRRQAQKMSDLITQLLGITRLEQGTEKASLRLIDLSELVSVCCEDCPPPEGSGAELLTDIRPGVVAEADAGLVSRLMSNLLQNAWKYGGPHVRVSLSESGGRAVLEVADDGPGIPKEELPKIWRRFWQADPSRAGDGGSGLGLYMVRQIAELHGGRAECESGSGKGTVFRVELPQKKI